MTSPDGRPRLSKTLQEARRIGVPNPLRVRELQVDNIIVNGASQSFGSVTLSDLTVSTGDLDVTAGDLTVTAGDLTVTAGNIQTQGVGARMSRITSDQSISAATQTTVDWNSEDFDYGGVADISTNRFTVPTGYGGLWMVQAAVSWAGTDPGTADLQIAINGTNDKFLHRGGASLGTYAGVSGSILLDLDAADYVTIEVTYQNASIVRYSSGGIYSYASMWKVN